MAAFETLKGDLVCIAFLDGEPQPFMQAADEEEGYVICDVVEDGCLVIGYDEEWEHVTKRGKVEIRFVDLNDPVVTALPNYCGVKLRDKHGRLHDDPKTKQSDGSFGWPDAVPA